jgi:hypothetical protein
MNGASATLIPSPPRLLRGLSEIAQHYDLILCDVWGVVHNGVACFPKTLDALIRFREKGGTVLRR